MLILGQMGALLRGTDPLFVCLSPGLPVFTAAAATWRRSHTEPHLAEPLDVVCGWTTEQSSHVCVDLLFNLVFENLHESAVNGQD